MELKDVVGRRMSQDRRNEKISFALALASQNGTLGDFFETMSEDQKSTVIGAIIDAELATTDLTKESK